MACKGAGERRASVQCLTDETKRGNERGQKREAIFVVQMSIEDAPALRSKVVVLGVRGSGKTTMIQRFCKPDEETADPLMIGLVLVLVINRSSNSLTRQAWTSCS